MKTVVIPDVHLKPFLFDGAAWLLERGMADEAVCLMDLPDDWGQTCNIALYARTYDRAAAFAGQYPGTRWCWGNHDLCYFWNQRESGYSPMAAQTVKRKLLDLQKAVPEELPVSYVYRVDDVLFSHGGVLDYFVRENTDPKIYEDADAVLAEINGLGMREMWNDASPIWLRPQDCPMQLFQQEKLLQVVGHTPMESITREKNLISTDVFSTYRDGSPIGTQEFLLLDTRTWDYTGVKCPVPMK